jgi:hypothetical protein
MDHLHELMIVPIVHRHTDDHWSLHREGSLQRGRDLLGAVYPQPVSAEGLGKWHDVDRTKIDAGRTRCINLLFLDRSWLNQP